MTRRDRGPRGERAAEFLVPVSELARVPGARRAVRFEGTLAGLAVRAAAVPEGAPIEVDVVLESVTEGVLVSGRIRTVYTGECRRCLGPASGALEVEVCELATESPVEGESYALGTELDLAPLVRDACILSLPLAPLCAEGCRGLCPACGANRNLEECSCTAVRDPRWAALDALVGKDAGGRPERPGGEDG